jgi:hypothetical protein
VVDTGGLSGLVVEVPEAEPVVAEHRHRLDANARLGVPAHVTVLFPFVPPADIDEEVLTELGALFAGVPEFAVAFTSTAWFDEDVLWLAPADPAPFLTLTRTVESAYPEHPAYAGQYLDLAPHLTVGHASPLPALKEAERVVEPMLPVTSQVRAVTLLCQPEPTARWVRRARFPLASTDPRRHGPA